MPFSGTDAELQYVIFKFGNMSGGEGGVSLFRWVRFFIAAFEESCLQHGKQKVLLPAAAFFFFFCHKEAHHAPQEADTSMGGHGFFPVKEEWNPVGVECPLQKISISVHVGEEYGHVSVSGTVSYQIPDFPGNSLRLCHWIGKSGKTDGTVFRFFFLRAGFPGKGKESGGKGGQGRILEAHRLREPYSFRLFPNFYEGFIKGGRPEEIGVLLFSF